jgi:hypothetical protein
MNAPVTTLFATVSQLPELREERRSTCAGGRFVQAKEKLRLGKNDGVTGGVPRTTFRLLKKGRLSAPLPHATAKKRTALNPELDSG